MAHAHGPPFRKSSCFCLLDNNWRGCVRAFTLERALLGLLPPRTGTDSCLRDGLERLCDPVDKGVCVSESVAEPKARGEGRASRTAAAQTPHR
eukprot:6209700-Pleurochrysis_carterae.AAC.3